jgi:hypothetical protein
MFYGVVRLNLFPIPIFYRVFGRFSIRELKNAIKKITKWYVRLKQIQAEESTYVHCFFSQFLSCRPLIWASLLPCRGGAVVWPGPVQLPDEKPEKTSWRLKKQLLGLCFFFLAGGCPRPSPNRESGKRPFAFASSAVCGVSDGLFFCVAEGRVGFPRSTGMHLGLLLTSLEAKRIKVVEELFFFGSKSVFFVDFFNRFFGRFLVRRVQKHHKKYLPENINDLCL